MTSISAAPLAPKSLPLLWGTAALSLGLVWIAPSAQALTLNSSSGSWTNTVGGSNISFPTVGAESQVRWGDPVGSQNSGLGFTGVGSGSILPGASFLVGTLRHFNQTIWGGAASGVDLGINLDFAGLGNQLFNFTLAIDETPNGGTCAYYSVTPCADKISWLNAQASHSFISSGTEYTLELLGFTNAPNGSLVTDLISQEGGNNAAYLYARVTEVEQPPEDVPEPMGALGLLGAIALGWWRKVSLA